MKILLTHSTALELLRDTRRNSMARPKVQRIAFQPDLPRGKREWDELISSPVLLGASSPLHIAVRHEGKRSRTSRAVYHPLRREPPERGFFKAANGIYFSNPEYCFLQMADMLPLAKLIELGYEFCGTYVRDDRPNRSTTYGVEPATSLLRLSNFLKANAGRSQVRIARRALHYVQGGSNSPMETILTMLLCLPRSMGGYNLPFPQLNERVRVRLPDGETAERFCDLYWRKLRLAFEYDSDEFHQPGEKWRRDSGRRAELGAKDIEVVSVGRSQVEDVRELEKLAVLVCCRAGLRRDRGRFEYSAVRRTLRRQLMPWTHGF